MADGTALEAGRYAVYVWPAYGISALVLGTAVVQTVLKARRWRRAAEGDLRTRERRDGAGPSAPP